VPAPGAHGLPALPRPGTPPGGLTARLRGPLGPPGGANVTATAFVAGPPAGVRSKVGARPLFLLLGKEERMSSLQADIEARLATAAPDVEVLLAEIAGGGTLRVFIDHPDGITLDLCEQVTNLLGDFRERYALEVSSPGLDRPLTKPAHFRRFLGRRARVRTRDAREGHRSFTGEL